MNNVLLGFLLLCCFLAIVGTVTYFVRRKTNSTINAFTVSSVEVQKLTTTTSLTPLPFSTPTPLLTLEMNGSTIILTVGEKRKLQLPGNATTGYAWRIVNQEGDSIQTSSKWRYKLDPTSLVGSGGYFQKELIATEIGVTVLYLIYDAVAEPQLGYSYFLQFNVQAQ